MRIRFELKASLAPRTTMKFLGQTRLRAQGPMNLLKLKSKTRIGCWNVRTLFQASKLAQLARELRRYNIAVLGVSGEVEGEGYDCERAKTVAKNWVRWRLLVDATSTLPSRWTPNIMASTKVHLREVSLVKRVQ